MRLQSKTRRVVMICCLPSRSRLSSLTLQSADPLLSPFRSHLGLKFCGLSACMSKACIHGHAIAIGVGSHLPGSPKDEVAGERKRGSRKPERKI